MLAALDACGGELPPPPLPPLPKQVAAPDVIIPQLTDLLTIVDLEWLVLLRPRRLARTAWLAPALSRVLKDQRLEIAKRTTGIDLREVPELAVAGYRQDVVLQLVRHEQKPVDVERRFRERLTNKEVRTELGHQVVSLWGEIGTRPHGFVSVGIDVAGFQYGGDEKRGPGRIALLYALDKLENIPTVLQDIPLAKVHAALGADGVPPVEVLFPGPFEGDLARGARGLLAASTGVGISITPTDRRTVRLVVLLAGDYARDTEKATELLLASYQDLAGADLGHLLGMHEPEVAPVAIAVPFGLGIGVELDAEKLFRGLSAATVDDIEEIMR